MKILTDEMLPLKQDVAVAIGLFDGIHLGHMALIDELKKHGRTLIFTFDYKPKEYRCIYTEAEKLAILRKYQIDYYYMQRFNQQFADLTPADFLQYLKNNFRAAHIIVGFDFRFGKGALGDDDYLLLHQKEWDYTVDIVPEVIGGGEKISSTRIRALIERGDVGEAAELLSRFYFIDGVIEPGARLGATIGFPTANITTEKILPAFGVYATMVELDGKLYNGVTNVGVKPTVTNAGLPTVETFILDFAGDVYGREIRVYFVKMLRPEQKFGSIDELKAQMAIDSETAAWTLADASVYKKNIL